MKGDEIDGECIMHVEDKFIQKSGLKDCSKIKFAGSTLS